MKLLQKAQEIDEKVAKGEEFRITCRDTNSYKR